MNNLKHSEFRTAERLIFLAAILAPYIAAASLLSHLTGSVSYGADGRDHPLTGATISLYNYTNPDSKVVTLSNSIGRFAISLPVADYIILVDKNSQRVYQGIIRLRDTETIFDIKLPTPPSEASTARPLNEVLNEIISRAPSDFVTLQSGSPRYFDPNSAPIFGSNISVPGATETTVWSRDEKDEIDGYVTADFYRGTDETEARRVFDQTRTRLVTALAGWTSKETQVGRGRAIESQSTRLKFSSAGRPATVSIILRKSHYTTSGHTTFSVYLEVDRRK